jgi:glycosyltransferase involved in cell wall biosynthesis
MRILIDARFLGTGTGLSAYTENLIKNLEDIDKKNQYLILIEKQYFNQLNLKAPNFKKIGISASHYSLAEQIKLPRLIKKLKPDLVHFTNFNHPLYFKGKSIFTIQDLTLLLYPPRVNFLKHFIYKIILNSAIRKAEKIIVPSQNTQKDLQKILKVRKEKIVMIPDGFTPPKVSDADSREIIKEKYRITRKYILYIGRFAPHKNIDGLLGAYQILKTKYSLNYQLVLAGKKDKDFFSLKKKTKELGLADDVVFTGFIEEQDLGSLYKHASLLMLVSFYEGFGLPALEAFSVGTPVLASKASSLPEITGKAALLVDPQDIKAIADGMCGVLVNHKIREALIKKGFEQTKKFSWFKMASETLKVYNEFKEGE